MTLPSRIFPVIIIGGILGVLLGMALLGRRSMPAPETNAIPIGTWRADVRILDGVEGIRYETGDDPGALLNDALKICGEMSCTIVETKWQDPKDFTEQQFTFVHHGWRTIKPGQAQWE